MIDVNEGDVVQGAKVAKRYTSGLGGTETVVLEVPYHGKERRVINEMKQMGWTMDFKRDSTGKMFFREADEWDEELGSRNK